MTRERKAVKFIESYTKRNGYPPSVREVGAYLGYKHPMNVQYLLDQMIAAGLITRVEGQARSIRVRNGR